MHRKDRRLDVVIGVYTDRSKRIDRWKDRNIKRIDEWTGQMLIGG